MAFPLALGALSTTACEALLASPHPTVLLPVGSTEPHGPHLPLATDAILSEEASLRAAAALRATGVTAVVAPTLPYGVTRFAQGFAGATSLSPDTTERLVRELLEAWRAAGFACVCVVNHHLEPEHVACLARAAASVPGAVFANQLTRRWGRTLSEEFKRGDCHAGRYESAMVMAARPDLVDDEARRALPPVPISLSAAIRAGRTTFRAMGGDRAYFGAPADATAAEGDSLYDRHVAMVLAEVRESLGLDPRPAP